MAESHLDRSLGAMAVRSLKQCRRKVRVADSTGVELSGKQLLTRAIVLRNRLTEYLRCGNGVDAKPFVGVLLPPSFAAIATNLALTLDRRVAVNLSYAVTNQTLNDCIAIGNLKLVITSRRFLTKTKLAPNCETLFLEDIARSTTKYEKILGWLTANLRSADSIVRNLELDSVASVDLATLIFTSGSTGVPKGVMLTHANIAHNLREIEMVGRFRNDDVLIGVLPFFHSFGFTASLWATLTQNVTGVFHYSPLEAETIGMLAEKYKATILLSTPTFLTKYLKRISPAQFGNLNFVLVGAEPMNPITADSFESRFGTRPVTAYGTTETSPLISVNVPASRSPLSDGSDRREGSVGRPAQGVSIKITSSEPEAEGHELPIGQSGIIHVCGPNVMRGYFERDDLTSQVLKNGWYNTEDIGYVDTNGFVFITGRRSRFSKIGGEMVPHVPMEQCLAQLLQTDELDESVRVGVTAFQNEKGEEKIAIAYVESDCSVEVMRAHLKESGFPNLHVPLPAQFYVIAEIPCLPTGKLDLLTLRETARNHFEKP